MNTQDTYPELIAQHMALYEEGRDIQVEQTEFRMRIAKSWDIKEDDRILEVGCGQGDMTAVLADAVGPKGFVRAVDLAAGDYGFPVCLGDSLRVLKATPLGERIDYSLNFDILAPENTFADDSFDAVVFAHCSWYYETQDILKSHLARVRPYAKQLYFSEWDLQPSGTDQIAHLLAVLIQGQIGVFKPRSGNNARTLLTRSALQELLSECGWRIVALRDIDTAGLQNGNWEVSNCLMTSEKEAELLDVPVKYRQYIKTQTDLLAHLAGNGATHSLSTYSIVAERSD
jgi:SAM-dependent methyltransferase